MTRRAYPNHNLKRRLFVEGLESRVLFAADVPGILSQASDLGALGSAAIIRPEVVNSPTDVDMFKFRVAAGQRIGFDIDTPTNGPPGLGSFLRLFDSNGRELAANNDQLAPDDPPPGPNSGSQGFDSYIEYGFSTSGTYFIGVSNWQHRSYNPVNGSAVLGSDKNWLTGSYKLVLTERSQPDPDDQISEARNLGTVGFSPITRTDSISIQTDVDMFKFTARAGQRIGFDIDTTQNGPGGLGSYLRVFNSSGVELAANNDAVAPDDPQRLGFDSYIEYTFPQAGTYYVGVSNWQNVAYNALTGADFLGSNSAHLTGSYTLLVTERTQPDPDDQISESRNLGTVGSSSITRSDSISIQTDVDMFKFTARAGQRIGFDIDTSQNGPGGLGSYLRVFNRSGVELAANNDAVAPDDPQRLGFDSYLEYTFPQAGTYYVGVSNWQNVTYNALTGADFLSSNSAHLTGSYALIVRDYTHFVSKVPDIMQNIGWNVARQLQNNWFSAPGRVAGSEVLPIDSTTVKMDWTLSYQRASSAYNDLLNNYANAAARTELKKQLEAAFRTTSATTISFGDFSTTGNALHAQHVNFRSVSTYELDELTGALGNYSYYVIPKGVATRTSSGIRVTINEVGIYLRDSFDFNGTQQLGYWKTANGVSATPRSGYTPVSNADYRAYRDATRSGGDFIIFSDVKVTRLNQPTQFTL